MMMMLATFDTTAPLLARLFISADLEGVAGVTHASQVFPKPSDSLAPYQQAIEQLATEVGWVIEGLQSVGLQSTTVNDSHAHMTNLFKAGFLQHVSAGVRLISGKPKPFGMMAGLSANAFDAVALVGYHAKANTPNAVLCHSFTEAVADISLNGVSLGEAGFNLLLVEIGYGVPIVLASGDSALNAELKALKPTLSVVQTKESISWACANCFSVQQVQQSYQAVALRVQQQWQATGGIGLLMPTPAWLPSNQPWEVVFTVQTPLLADVLALLPASTRISGTAVQWQIPRQSTVAEQVRWAYQSVQCAYSLLGYANGL
jgi:D-amino peptidase